MTLFLQNIISLECKPNQPMNSEAGSFLGSDNEGRSTTKISGIEHPHT